MLSSEIFSIAIKVILSGLVMGVSVQLLKIINNWEI